MIILDILHICLVGRSQRGQRSCMLGMEVLEFTSVRGLLLFQLGSDPLQLECGMVCLAVR